MRWHRSRTMALPDSLNTVTVRKLANTLSSYNTKVNTKLDGKADKVSQATSGHLASLDGNGNLQDSGATTTSFATAAQGAKADTAVQSVSINGGINLKSGTSVDIPLAVATGTSGATAGAMSSDDKMMLDGIEPGAEVNQNAFSNVKVGSTTVAASSKTDTVTIVGGTHTSVVGNSADKSVTISSTLKSEAAAQSGTTVSLVTTGEKYTWGAKQDQLAFDGTYNATSNKAATVSSITNKINALDVSDITANLGVGKTITALSETDGKIAATASNIQISESQVTNLTTHLNAKAPIASPALTGTPTAPTAAQGTRTTQIATTEFVVNEIDAKIEELGDAMVYQGTLAGGNTGSYGALTPAANKGWTYKVTTAGKIDGFPVEVGDMLICNTDNTAAATSSNYTTIVNNWDYIQTNIDGAVIGPSSAVTSASVAGFDGTSGHKIKQLTAAEIKTAAGLDKVKNQAITVSSTSVSDGMNTFNKYTHPQYDTASAAAVMVGRDSTGHVVIGAVLQKGDVGLGNVVNTGDSDTPVENGTDKFTTGGAYTALAGKVDRVDGKGLSTNDYTTAEKNKLTGIAAGAEVNQNAFSNIKVGSVTVAADTKTDTVELVGSQHVVITPDATNDKITIATDISNQTAYTSKGSATKVPQITTNSLGQVTSITEVTISGVTPASHKHGNINNDGTLQTDDVTIASGDKLVITDASNSDKIARSSTEFDGSTTTTALTPKGTFEAFAKSSEITTAINNLDTAKTSTDGTNVQVKVTEANGLISAVNITTDNTENKNNKVTAWSATTTDAHYPSEKLVKSSLDNKADKSATVSNVAWDSTNKKITKTINGTTSDVVTAADLNYVSKNIVGTSATATANGQVTGNGAYLNHIENGAVTSTHKITGGGITKVTTDASGNITITSTEAKTGTVTSVAAGVGLTTASGSAITSTGTVKAKLKSETAASVESTATSGTAANRQYAIGVDASGYLSVNVPWANTTYTAPKLGFGYAAATGSSGAFTATISDYALNGNGGIVAIKFAAAVPANATLNISSQGAKNIKYRGSNITANIIQKGDIAYFMYDGTNYTLLGTDRSVGEMTDTEVTDLLAALT